MNSGERNGPSTRQSHHKYFPHIDGLRALAIVPVVLYHLCPALCPGGFAGVDVFFVISGYLIAGGIITDLDKGSFSFTDFYVRRIKRILPAYLTLIAGVMALSVVNLSVDEFKSVSTTSLFSILFSANLYFEKVIGYFDLAASNNPLLNLWSLGVEEQFYLAIPVCLWLLWIFKRRLLPVSLAVLLVVSLVVCQAALWTNHGNFAFFMLPSRAWELLAGAVLSQMPSPRLQTANCAWRWAGLLLVILPYALLNDQTVFPGLAAVPSVLGSVLLIRYGQEGSGSILLRNKLSVWIGKISYSLYLWHWPLFVLLGSSTTLPRAASGLVLAVLAAYLSLRYVETPIRRSKTFGTKRAFTLLIGGSGALAGVCLLSWQLQSNNGELLHEIGGVKTWMVLRDNSRYTCNLADLESGNKKFLVPVGQAGEAPTFVLWGDSHALAILPGVDSAAQAKGVAGLYVNMKNVLTTTDAGARRDREPVLQWLVKQQDIKNIFLVNFWLEFLTSDDDINEVVGIIARLHDSGKRVFVFQTPPPPNPRAVQMLSWGLNAPEFTLQTDVQSYAARAKLQEKLAAELTRRNLAVVLPLNQAFFNGVAYTTVTTTESYFVDLNHLNRAGAVKAMNYLAPMIWPAAGK